MLGRKERAELGYGTFVGTTKTQSLFFYPKKRRRMKKTKRGRNKDKEYSFQCVYFTYATFYLLFLFFSCTLTSSFLTYRAQ